MDTDERFKMLLEATPERRAAVDAVLTGEVIQEEPSLRLYRMGEAAQKIGLSRTTLWRAIRERRLVLCQY